MKRTFEIIRKILMKNTTHIFLVKVYLSLISEMLQIIFKVAILFLKNQ